MGITALRRDAELLSLYTGLPYQSALGIAGAVPRRQDLIPTPGPQQERLERWLLRRLAGPSCDPVYPWGIRWVYPTADGLTVQLEGDSMARELARVLPPRPTRSASCTAFPAARFSPPSAKKSSHLASLRVPLFRARMFTELIAHRDHSSSPRAPISSRTRRWSLAHRTALMRWLLRECGRREAAARRGRFQQGGPTHPFVGVQ